MHFENEKDVLAWFDSQERVLTPGFLARIPWQDVKNYVLDAAFVPVLTYMRDVESFTSIYFEQLRNSPTWKNLSIRRFMERWSTEEPVHGELLNRFLCEAGFTTSEKWFDESRAKIPKEYLRAVARNEKIVKCIGRNFSGVHMTWGAINEHTTLTGYQRLSELSGHPVLQHILGAIIKEEARHSFFYWSVARILLAGSAFRRFLARTIVDRFWTPVGEGTKPKEDADELIRILFKGEEGMRVIAANVNDRIARLPGFDGFTTVTKRIASAAF